MILGLDPDLDSIRAAQLETDARQGRGRLRRQATPGLARANPVADLERVRADSLVQTATTDDSGFVSGEEAEREVLAQVEVPAEAP
jgi:hypothetical protein